MIRKYGVGIWAFSPVGDRFNPEGYKPRLSLDQQMRMAARARGVKGVELHYPTDFTEEQVGYVEELLKGLGLQLPTLCVNLFTHPRWQRGSITSTDPRTREEAIETAKVAMDISEKVGSMACTLWLGQDGHDYLFNDYRRAWDRMVEGIAEIADHNRRVTLFLEYKHKEPRTHMQVANMAKTLYMIDEMAAKNVGVVIDVGHALMADENMAESVVLADRRKVPFAMHFNDSYGFWDDDMIVGAINFWRYAELFYQLRKVGYDGWYDLDIFPYREDPVKAVEQSLSFIDYMITRVEENYDRIDALVEEGDVHRTLEGLREIFLKGY